MRPFPVRQWLMSLLVASLVLWLMFLGNSPLRDWDEGTYALVAREIYRTGNWLHPTLGGEPFLLKPPLMLWLIAGCYKLGGVQELTTRLPGAVLTALGVPLLYLIGRLVFRQSLPALFTALVYMTMLPVVRHGRLAMLDGMVISFFLLLLFCLLQARQQRSYALGVGFCLGLITLTKGMIVLLFMLIAGLFLLAEGQLALLVNPYFWMGMLFGNAPAIAWYFAQWQHYGNIFLQVHFQSQTFDRLSQSVEGNTGPVWYYLIELIKYGFPWLLFLPGGLSLAWKKRPNTWANLTLVGTIIYFGTISLMRTKLPWYVMPVYPFLALAIGANLNEVWQYRNFKTRTWVGFLAIFAIAGLGGCVYFVVADPQPVLILMGLILSVSMGVATWMVVKSDRRFMGVLFGGMYLTLALLMSSKSWIWELNEAFPVKPVAVLIREYVPPGTTIYTSFAYNRPSLDFYSDCKVIPAQVSDFRQRFYLLIDNPSLHKIDLSGRRVLGSDGGFTLVAPPIS